MFKISNRMIDSMKFYTTSDFFEFVNENIVPYNSIITNIKLLTNNFEINSLTNLRDELKTYIDLHKHIRKYSLIVGKRKTDISTYNLDNLLDVITVILKEQQLKELEESQKKYLNAEKALEEENQRKMEARQELQKIVIEKLAERKEKQKEEDTKINKEVSNQHLGNYSLNKLKKDSELMMIFNNDLNNVELFFYLVANYEYNSGKSKDLDKTKFNHIHFFFKNPPYLAKSVTITGDEVNKKYKSIVMKYFNYDFKNSQIKVNIPKGERSGNFLGVLDNIYTNFNEMKLKETDV